MLAGPAVRTTLLVHSKLTVTKKTHSTNKAKVRVCFSCCRGGLCKQGICVLGSVSDCFKNHTCNI